MPRQLRIEYAGAIYHVMARGDRREEIVRGDTDRESWLQTLGEACGKTGWRVHAWVLMSNHYHLAIETPEPNLVAGMGWFQNTYTRRFNSRHGLWGHVFGGRYKAVLVEAEEQNPVGGYLATLLDYIHLNPVRAGMVSPQQGRGLLDYPWSSLSRGYAVTPGRRAGWLETNLGFWFGQVPDTVAGRRRMVEGLERRAREEGERSGCPDLGEQTLHSTLERGWYWGSEAFREKMLALVEGAGKKKPVSRNYRTKGQRTEEEQSAAEQIVREGLQAMQLKDLELAGLSGSDPRKVAIAVRLQEETTTPQKWIADRLRMRSAANVSQQIRRFQRGEITLKSCQ